MRLLLYTVALPVLATCSAARADSYAALRQGPAFYEPEAAASAQDNAEGWASFSRPLPSIDSSAVSPWDGSPYSGIQDSGAALGAASSTAIISSADGSPLLAVYLPTSFLEDYAGVPICALTSHCSGEIDPSNNSVKPSVLDEAFAAIAPEPPSMLLVATGLFGLASVIRRRAQNKHKMQ